jgi:hypothetical protein
LNTRLVASAVAVLAVAVFIAGCGGGDDDATASISKAQFIKKADAACSQSAEQVQVELAALLKENDFSLNETHSAAESSGLVAVLASSLETQVEEIRALGVPDGDEDEVEAILTAFEEGVEKAEEDPKAAANGEVDLLGSAGELAREYGFKVCAQG